MYTSIRSISKVKKSSKKQKETMLIRFHLRLDIGASTYSTTENMMSFNKIYNVYHCNHHKLEHLLSVLVLKL